MGEGYLSSSTTPPLRKKWFSMYLWLYIGDHLNTIYALLQFSESVIHYEVRAKRTSYMGFLGIFYFFIFGGGVVIIHKCLMMLFYFTKKINWFTPFHYLLKTNNVFIIISEHLDTRQCYFELYIVCNVFWSKPVRFL